mgnify:CR=1 FL=1
MMVRRKDLRSIGTQVWEIGKEFQPGMRVPARLVADETILPQALSDRSLEQLANTATLPGVVAPCLD